MIKVMVVDDELPIREWLQFTFAKCSEPIQMVGVMANGMDALACFKKESPDLVLTDIRMAGMDGIELLMAIRSISDAPYVVMLTSHDDFEYVRHALKHNADEYVLKSEINLQAVDRLVAACIEKKRHFDDGLVHPLMTMQVRDLVVQSEAALLQTLHEAGLLIEDVDQFAVFSACPTDIDKNRSFGLMQHETISSQQLAILPLRYDAERAIWIVWLPHMSSTLMQINVLNDYGQSLCLRLHMNIGASGLTDRRTGLRAAILKSIRALSVPFYCRRPGHSQYQAGAELQAQSTEAIKEVFYSAMTNISNKSFEQSYHSVIQLLRLVEQHQPDDIPWTRQLFLDLVNHYKFVSISAGFDQFEVICRTACLHIVNAVDFASLKSAVDNFINQAKAYSLSSFANYSSYVKDAIAYVQKHYADIEKISDVTDRLNINLEYFCRLFKSDVGMTFNNYLTEYRLKIAVNLLLETNLKIHEIAEQVGYKNLSYFSRLFKQRIGVNPYHYKSATSAVHSSNSIETPDGEQSQH